MARDRRQRFQLEASLSNTSLILNGVGIVQALVKQDRTVTQLQDVTGCDRRTIGRWVRELRANGLVRVSGVEQRAGKPRIYSWQQTPFEKEDE